MKRAPSKEDSLPWPATLAGLSATFVGIGLARFAYTPLIPVLIEAGWFAPSDVIYLGAANLAGYLAGALGARPLTRQLPSAAILRLMMVLATLALLACAEPLSFAWYFVWRFAAGLSGGMLMVLAAPAVLSLIAPARRGFASGIIFTGVGLGIAASGTLVPLLLRAGLFETWIGLAITAAVLTVATWRVWPEPSGAGRPDVQAPERRSGAEPVALKALYVEYGLAAVGLVPHMVFLVDFVARGLDQGVAAGAGYWTLFGLGAIAGAVAAGQIGDRIGFKWAFRLGLLIEAAGVAWLAFSDNAVALGLSSVVIGGFIPGIVALALGRLHDILPADGDRTAAWGKATTAFAIGQAAAAYGFSYLYAGGLDYALLFALGGAAFLLALALDFAAAAVQGRAKMKG